MRLKQLLAISDCAHASIGAMASVRLEEEEPVRGRVAGWVARIRPHQADRADAGRHRPRAALRILLLQIGRAQRDG